jgi:hypothetical protein
MRPGITTRLFRSFVLLLFAHAAAVQSQDTLLGSLVGGWLLVFMAVLTGLAGIAIGYSGAVALDEYLRRLAATRQDHGATSEGA